jgi:hypothetical protein
VQELHTEVQDLLPSRGFPCFLRMGPPPQSDRQAAVI